MAAQARQGNIGGGESVRERGLGPRALKGMETAERRPGRGDPAEAELEQKALGLIGREPSSSEGVLHLDAQGGLAVRSAVVGVKMAVPDQVVQGGIVGAVILHNVHLQVLLSRGPRGSGWRFRAGPRGSIRGEIRGAGDTGGPPEDGSFGQSGRADGPDILGRTLGCSPRVL